MAKDPAFMFYPQDFIMGTMFMNDSDVGKYIRLLCAQHQMGGIIPKGNFNSMIGDSVLVKEKFIESEDGFFNERLMKEIEKRSLKSSNLSENAKKRWEKHTIDMQKQCKSNAIASDLHMPIEDVNENEIVVKKEDVIPIYLKECFDDFLKMRKSLRKPVTEKGIKLLLLKLQKMATSETDQVKIVEQSIMNSWQGFFPLKIEQKKYGNQRATDEEIRAQLERMKGKLDDRSGIFGDMGFLGQNVQTRGRHVDGDILEIAELYTPKSI